MLTNSNLFLLKVFNMKNTFRQTMYSHGLSRKNVQHKNNTKILRYINLRNFRSFHFSLFFSLARYLLLHSFLVIISNLCSVSIRFKCIAINRFVFWGGSLLCSIFDFQFDFLLWKELNFFFFSFIRTHVTQSGFNVEMNF